MSQCDTTNKAINDIKDNVDLKQAQAEAEIDEILEKDTASDTASLDKIEEEFEFSSVENPISSAELDKKLFKISLCR